MSSDKQNLFNKRITTQKSNKNNSDLPQSSNLNDEFAGYLDYVRSVEADNEKLRAEKSDLIVSCNKEIDEIKSTYGNEINTLRKALDESKKEQYTTILHNNKLLEENDCLKIKFSQRTEEIKELQGKYEVAEDTARKYRKAAQQYDALNVKNNELSESLTLLEEALQIENSKRIEAESRANTSTAEIEFLKKVNANNTRESRENSINITNRTEAYFKEKLIQEKSKLRDEMTAEFNQYKVQMECVYNQKIEELSTLNSLSNKKYHKILVEKKAFQNEIESLHMAAAQFENTIATLNARESKHQDVLAKQKQTHDEFLREVLDENSELKENLFELNNKITTLISEKMAADKDTQMVRMMLKGEQSRVNLTDKNGTKRRRIEGDLNEEDCVGWSKNGIKIICASNNTGKYIQIINHSEKAVNINEYTINFETANGIEPLYTFAPRVIEVNQSLYVWGLDDNVLEDESNLKMNVSFPLLTDIKSCRLNNDMDETESSITVETASPKRKILKANIKKNNDEKECSIM